MLYARPMSVSINPERIARDVIVVSASAGGIRAVIEILARLPADLPAFIGVVIHRGAGSTSNWSDVLGMKTKLRVVEPTDGDSLTRGVVYIAPADCHMRFEHDISAFIFCFTLSWNECLYALVFMSSPENKTVPVGLVTELVRGDSTNGGR